MSVYVVLYVDPWTPSGDVVGVFANLEAVRRWYASDKNQMPGPTVHQRGLPGYGSEFYPYDVQIHDVLK